MPDALADRLVGITVELSFTVTDRDVQDFVRLSGDDYEAHTDPDFMARSEYGQIIAHGALLVGYMSAAGTAAIRAARGRGETGVPVSLGYDRLRFVAPVFLGTTVTVAYTITAVDEARRRSLADITVAAEDGRALAVGTHVMKWMNTDA